MEENEGGGLEGIPLLRPTPSRAAAAAAAAAAGAAASDAEFDIMDVADYMLSPDRAGGAAAAGGGGGGGGAGGSMGLHNLPRLLPFVTPARRALASAALLQVRKGAGSAAKAVAGRRGETSGREGDEGERGGVLREGPFRRNVFPSFPPSTPLDRPSRPPSPPRPPPRPPLSRRSRPSRPS